MNFRKSLFLIFLLLPSACSNVQPVKYKDTSALEQPPGFNKIRTSTDEAKVEENTADTGLGDQVTLDEEQDAPVIEIKKSFARSWIIVGKALELNKIEIKDRNRDEGAYYVNFDPDEFAESGSGLMSFLFFKDYYYQGVYRISVVVDDSKTAVTAAMNVPGSDNFDDADDEDSFEPLDGSPVLIKLLFDSIRDNLPVNSL